VRKSDEYWCVSKEIVVEEEGTKAFEAAGWYERKVAFIGVRGAPDRWYLRKGMWAPVEYKRRDKAPDGHQIRRHREMRAHGQEVYVIDSIEDAYALCDRLTAESDRRAAL
jgi:hypothetical protein